MTRTPACLLLLTASPILAAQPPIADPAALDRVVEQFTGVPVGQPGGAREPVDRRLRLRPCPAPPQAQWHGAPGRTVMLTCPEGGGWRIYVNLLPTGATARAPAQPAVKRGENLTVVVRGQGFAIRRPAEALEGGALGEWIAVRTGPGTDPIRARLVQPGVAEVELP